MGQKEKKGKKSTVISLEKNRQPENIRCSTSLRLRQMEIKTVMRSQFIPTRLAKSCNVRPWCFALSMAPAGHCGRRKCELKPKIFDVFQLSWRYTIPRTYTFHPRLYSWKPRAHGLPGNVCKNVIRSTACYKQKPGHNPIVDWINKLWNIRTRD